MKHLLALLAALFSWSIASANPDVLLDIVQNCVDASRPGYCAQCRAPQTVAMCPAKNACISSTDVWRESQDFVAIRDIKMCACPSNFVHGLVLPKAIVTGIEDPRRPDAIWQFAWDTAITRLSPEEVVLAVNSKSKRTQNQLHVHLVRMKPNIEPKLNQAVTTHADQLQQIWQVAHEAAQSHQMQEYGILVTAKPQGGFRVVLTKESPEGQFTQAVCSP
jgi:CDP-diacylglycerol pyrophosphatase